MVSRLVHELFGLSFVSWLLANSIDALTMFLPLRAIHTAIVGKTCYFFLDLSQFAIVFQLSYRFSGAS